MLHNGIFGYANTDVTQTAVDLNNVPTPNPQTQNQRFSRQLQPSQNIFPSKNFINSKLAQNNNQPQLFNLGYSVRFENQQFQNLPRVEKKQPSNIQQGDIITGTRKQNIEIDLPSSSFEDSQIFLKNDGKKRKVFEFKPTAASQNFENMYLENTSQSYVSPTTQQNLEALEKIKDIDYQQDLSELYQQKYTWRNLSPNVKIIRSTEIPAERIENRALNFDHEKALSKSEGFGFSDAMRDENFELNLYPQKESFRNVETIRTTPKPEQLRVIQVNEQINEAPVKPQISDPIVLKLNKKAEPENIFQTSEVNTPTKLVKLPPSAILQAVDGTPLNPQQQPEIIKIPKQTYVQHIIMPQYQSTPKYRGKFKYVKHAPMTRGNIVYTRKAIANLDYMKKSKIKPELRREFKPPPVGTRI